MPKSTMKSISVTKKMGERIRAAADERGCAMSDIIEAACENLPTDPAAVKALADKVWANMPQNVRTARGG